ncbi:MAG: 2Fe-2S iron-sulfur cluster binding domain-containing protein [Proteobacteria bacterium]|nr:2Fe-2S iron-sulfur cluster binding domain-containing protein [Pseudomonadota bacterium]
MKLYVTDKDGKEHTLEGTNDWSVMEVMRENGIEVLAQCGGSCACATCHVYVEGDWNSKLPPPSEEEIGMLDGAFEVQDNSRLSCQIKCSPAYEGLKVKVAPGSY